MPLKCSVRQMAIAQRFQSDLSEEHKLFHGLFGKTGDRPNIGRTSRVSSIHAPGTRSRPNSRGVLVSSGSSDSLVVQQPSRYWFSRGGGNMTLFHKAEGRIALDPKLRAIDTPGPQKLPDAYDPETQMRASSPLHPPMNTMQFSSQTAKRFPIKIDRNFSRPRSDRSRDGFDSGSNKRRNRTGNSSSSVPAGESTIISETWTLDEEHSKLDSVVAECRPSTSQTASSMWSISDGWDKRPRPQNESLLYKFEHGRARSAAPRPRKVVVRKADAPFGQHTMGVGERVHPLLWDGNPSTTFSVGSPGKQDKAAFPGAIYDPNSTLQEAHLPDCNFSSQERFVGFGAVMPPAVTSQCRARHPNYALTQPSRPCSAKLITGRNQPKLSLGAFSPGPKYNIRDIRFDLLSTKPSTFSFVIGDRHGGAQFS
jgi:hypothetical protein